MGDDLKVRLAAGGESAETTLGGLRQLARAYRNPSADGLPEDLDADDLYPVPPTGYFKSSHGKDLGYIEAPDLEAVADDVIESWPEFHGLQELRIRVLWKDKGTPKAMGMCKKAPADWRAIMGVDYLIWVGAEDVRSNYFTRRQVEALLYHELCHIEVDDETEKLRIAPHDAEVFYMEFRRYGIWRRDHQRFGQLSLDGDFARGEGLQQPRYWACPDCGEPAHFGERCAGCTRLAEQDAAAHAPARPACLRCGVVVEPEDAAGPAYRIDHLCFECREAELERQG